MKYKNTIFIIIALISASLIWLPSMHVVFQEDVDNFISEEKLSPITRKLANYQINLWINEDVRKQEIGRMRLSNGEWDFMGRTFLVMALTNISIIDEKYKENSLKIINKIIDDTLKLEKENGIHFFLLPYSKASPFVVKPERSQFIDGEIALMLALSRLLKENEEYKIELDKRIEIMVNRMNNAITMNLESYPDECWLFCNSISLLSIRLKDYLDGTDHSEFFEKWMISAKQYLLDKKTGLLISSFSMNGTQLDGPEGSSIFLAAHCLSFIYKDFAREQYIKAKLELGKNILGFGYATEWPDSWVGPQDIDSGPIIPFINLSAGSTGFAFLGAVSFRDNKYLKTLLSSLNLGGFPLEKNDKLRYCGSNQVGDAVLLYSSVARILPQYLKKRFKNE